MSGIDVNLLRIDEAHHLPPVIEGVVVPDNREERFHELAQGSVELLTEYEWSEIPEALQTHLLAFWEGVFYWALEHRKT